MSRVTSFSEWLIRQPVIWGSLACLAFYALVIQSAAEGSTLQLYFAGHLIAYCATLLFFIGVAALAVKLLGIAMQSATLDSIQLPTAATGGQAAEQAEQLAASLNGFSAVLQRSYLVRRIREALLHIHRKGSADTLETHLRHLEEADYARMHQSYSLVRLLTTTIPMLGFLGTVVGITLAVAKLKLSGAAIDTEPVVDGLSVAFNTTALALSLSMVLLFLKFCVEKVETQLLAAVDSNATQQLVGRFQQYGTEHDPHLASVFRMSEKLLASVEASVAKHSELLNQSFEKTSKQWSDVLSSTATTLDETLAGAVVDGLARHAEALNEGVSRHAGDLEQTLVKHAEMLNEGLQQHTSALAAAEQKLAEENRRHLGDVEAAVGEAMIVSSNRQEKLITQSEKLLKEMQTALIESAGSTVAQQEQLIKQGDILLRVVESTGQIKRLEDSLNRNLNALAGAHNFQQTVAGLSATLQLLGARLGNAAAVPSSIELTEDHSNNQAA